MDRPLKATNFNLPGQTGSYQGKVRDLYTIGDDLLVMVASDRISAFDVVLPRGIPYKGQVLNQIAARFMRATEDIVPNWLVATPDPQVAVGKKARPFGVEMVIRGYLSGHAAREYKAGKRVLCGVPMPDGMIENDRFPEPIITPTTKTRGGHDEDISREEVIKRGIVVEDNYVELEKHTRQLFARGTEMARERKLILVDTKYEFGKLNDDTIVLIDEIHTPDSSRYFYAEGYEERQRRGCKQRQLSKEFVRQWLIAGGFQGREGQIIPEMTDSYVASVSDRYIELYEQITGERFMKADTATIAERVERNILEFLANQKHKHTSK